jgi:hypothetical protein
VRPLFASHPLVSTEYPYLFLAYLNAERKTVFYKIASEILFGQPVFGNKTPLHFPAQARKALGKLKTRCFDNLMLSGDGYM